MHRIYLYAHYNEGNFIASGRQEPRVGGIVKADPFYINKIAICHIIEFLATKYPNGFEQFIG